MNLDKIKAKELSVLKQGLEDAVVSSRNRLYSKLGNIAGGTSETQQLFNNLMDQDHDERLVTVNKYWGPTVFGVTEAFLNALQKAELELAAIYECEEEEEEGEVL